MSEHATPLTHTGSERRRHDRTCELHPAKVYDERAEKFFGAETCDISVSGALLKVNRTMPVRAGDVFDVGIAWTPSDVVIATEGLTRSRVVRVTPIDRFSQAVAVEYAHPMEAKLAA